MSHILVLYTATEGPTRKVAQQIADRLSYANHDVDLCDFAQFAHHAHVKSCDGVIAGAPLGRGRHLTHVRAFIQKHLDNLNKIPTAFFSTGPSVAGNASQPAGARRCLAVFLAKTGWVPTTTALIAGTLFQRQYGFLKKLLLCRVARASGPTDTSVDYEFTDWSEVNRFADDFANCLSPVTLRDAGSVEQRRSEHACEQFQTS